MITTTKRGQLQELKSILKNEKRIITLDGYDRAVIAGWVHGCVDSAREALSYTSDPATAVVFASDIVDRSKPACSQYCIDLILDAISGKPNLFILQANHLFYHRIPFFPNDWWRNLTDLQFHQYTQVFDLLPYAVVTSNGLIVVHALPVPNLHNADHIKLGDESWYTLTWSRLNDQIATPDYFNSIEGSVIIRSHDHYGFEGWWYDKVLTITTSTNLPGTQRLLAVVDLTVDQIRMEHVDIINLDKEEIWQKLNQLHMGLWMLDLNISEFGIDLIRTVKVFMLP